VSVPGAGGDFLERMLGDIIRLMSSSAGGRQAQTELARTFAHSVATGGGSEPNVEPVARIQLEELARVAELHVSEITGLSVGTNSSALEIVALGPGSWAWRTLEDWSFILEAMTSATEEKPKGASAQSGPSRTRPDTASDDSQHDEGTGRSQGLGLADLGDLDFDDDRSSQTAEMLSRFVSTMGPMFAAMQLGSAVGHLARTTLGQYEIPVPRSGSSLLMVPQNIDRFAEDWSLPLDEVRLWICLRELTCQAVFSRPHVAGRFKELLVDVSRARSQDTGALVSRLGDLDVADPDALQRLLGDPSALLGEEPTGERTAAMEQLEALTAALLGYVEHVIDRAATRLLGGRGAIAEAWRRRQHEREPADRATELLLGLDLGPAQVERGNRFVQGVLERAGEDGLALLWSESRTLPTPAEVEAPGLWLERIRLPEDDAGSEA
jgi:putative hydrolase